MNPILWAFLLDSTVGDPPNSVHPVAWMGTFIGKSKAQIPLTGRIQPFIGGGLIAFGGATAVWYIGRKTTQLIDHLPPITQPIATAILLKSTFSLSGLLRASADVATALDNGDLPQARHWVGWHLVSRDTATLDESQVVAATIESIAENLSDGVVAPICAYLVGGLPWALVYRYINTCDAMLGYRDEREWIGKIPARTDDVLNWIPARITAWAILGAGYLLPNPSPDAVMIYKRDRKKTASPNAGRPMSAMAGVLDIELEKVGQYKLGERLSPPKRSDISRAKRVMQVATILSVGGIYLAKRLSARPPTATKNRA